MIMTSGLNHGVKASVPHLLGISFGVPTMFLAVGFGLTYLFERISWLHALIQIFGIVYLLYLAWLIAGSASLESKARHSKPLTFIQAALFQWINPKTWMLGTGAIAAFTTVGSNLSSQIVSMALVFFLMAFPSAGSWLVFGSWLQGVFKKDQHLILFNRLMALVLVASVLPVVRSLLSALFTQSFD